jgi:putative membrane protein insertion efficiency factor
MKHILIAIIKVYKKLISPLFPTSCRFYPTCSQYAVESIERFGALKGSWLAGKRIIRCNPFSKGGLDPVPQCSHIK